jgi:hypothetical protein
MKVDKDKVGNAVLALHYLTLDRDGRARNVFDWCVTSRLHEGFNLVVR